MEKLLLTNDTGYRLYHEYAKNLPIIDFHCHLQPVEIAEDRQFVDLGEIWLAHDHYKWRAMRTFGVPERLITGDSSYYEKFIAFAGIFPRLAGNPVYIWCQLELKRYFDISEPLSPDTADDIYNRTKAMIEASHMGPRYFIGQSDVRYIATTDDPLDDLRYHIQLATEGNMAAQVVPAFRPDKAMNIGSDGFADYISRLAEVSNTPIERFGDLIKALENRLVFFKAHGAGVTDNGMDNFVFTESTESERDAILKKALCGEKLSQSELFAYQTAFLTATAAIYKKHDFTMQLHIGAYRNANGPMAALLGGDTGFDCSDDPQSVRSLGQLLNALVEADALPRVILYPINPQQFEACAILAAAFTSGGIRGQVTLGAPWWFNDQAHGIRRQFESVSPLYPLALSVGMVTDSRSFLSYPRHELYRRILCNFLGELVERGEYFSGDAALKQIIEDVCYGNVLRLTGAYCKGVCTK